MLEFPEENAMNFEFHAGRLAAPAIHIFGVWCIAGESYDNDTTVGCCHLFVIQDSYGEEKTLKRLEGFPEVLLQAC